MCVGVMCCDNAHAKSFYYFLFPSKQKETTGGMKLFPISNLTPSEVFYSVQVVNGIWVLLNGRKFNSNC